MTHHPEPPTLMLAHCLACGAYTFPAEAWGCRVCGAPREQLAAVRCPQAPTLRNAVTVHAELAAGLPLPCVIGEVELAPGVVEEALIAAPSEAALTLGMPLRAEAGADDQGRLRWRFVPLAGAA